MSTHRLGARALARLLIVLLISALLLAGGVSSFPTLGTPQARAGEPPGGWSRVLVDGVGRLESVFAVSEEEAWAVGGEGQIWHYSHGAWRREPSPTTVGLNDVFMLSPKEGWAVGWRTYVVEGKVEKWSDIIRYRNGDWRREARFPDTALVRLYFTSAEEGWVVGYSDAKGAIALHYLNGQWEQSLLPPGGGSMFMVSAQEGWSVGVGILHYRDGEWQVEMTAEQFWADCPWGNLNAVYAISAQDVWAVGGCGFDTQLDEQRIIYHRTAAGWQRVALPPGAERNDYLSALSIPDGRQGWAVGRRGTMLRYVDGQWSFSAAPVRYQATSSARIMSMSMASPERAWMVGWDWAGGQVMDYQGIIMRYDPVRGFVLASARSSALLAPGQAADFGLTVQGIGGFSSPVTLAAGGLPTGTVATFSANPVRPTANVTLTLTTATDTPTGTYPVAVMGSGQGITYTVAVTLTVASPVRQSFLPWLGSRWSGGWQEAVAP